MTLSELINEIYRGLLQLTPIFRVVWAVTFSVGIAMFVLALILKKNPVRKKSPWIVGGIGLLIVLSSGTQWIASFF